MSDFRNNPIIVRRMIDLEKEKESVDFLENPDSSKQKFMRELREMGYEFEVSSQIYGFLPKHKDNLLPIVTRYYKSATTRADKSYFLGFFQHRGFEEVVPLILKDFYLGDCIIDRWAIGDRLFSIKSKRYIQDYLNIVADPKYGTGRQMIVLLLGKLRVEEAVPILISLLNDDDVRGHAISALSEFRNELFRDLFERFARDKNGFIRKESLKALRKLEK